MHLRAAVIIRHDLLFPALVHVLRGDEEEDPRSTGRTDV